MVSGAPHWSINHKQLKHHTHPFQEPKTPLRGSRLRVKTDTPYRPNKGANTLNNPKPETAVENRKTQAADMSGYFIGPIPPDRFLVDFMGLPKTSEFHDTVGLGFQIDSSPQDPLGTKEASKLFSKAVTEEANRIMGKRLFLVDTADAKSNATTSAHKQLRPDLTFLRPGVHEECTAERTSFNRLEENEGWGEVKPNGGEDAFDDDAKSFEATADRRINTLGQACAMNDIIATKQLRTRTFSLYLEERTFCCRFLLWTPSGVLVSSKFKFNKKDSPLGAFLKRLSLMTAEDRGRDGTIQPASPEEALAAYQAFLHRENKPYVYCATDNPNQVAPPDSDPSPNLKLPEDTKFIKIHVPTPGAAPDGRSVIAIRPTNCSPRSPIGRRTLCMEVYDLKTRRVVLLKDSWRAKDLTPEWEHLKNLNANEVPNVPTFLFGGDIRHDHHHVDLTTWACAEWNKGGPLEQFQDRQHQRFVTWEIGTPLHRYKCTKHVFQAIEGCISAHHGAWETVHLLHRDISMGNVLQLLRCKQPHSQPYHSGLLIDWEMAKLDVEDEPRQLERTGTQQFMSIKICRQLIIPHNVSDDLESFFWVVLYLLVRYAGYIPGRSGKPPARLLRTLFYVIDDDSGFLDIDGKCSLIIEAHIRMLGRGFSFRHLTGWVSDQLVHLRQILDANEQFDQQQHEPSMTNTVPPDQDPSFTQLCYASHSLMLKNLNEALDKLDWPDADGPNDIHNVGDSTLQSMVSQPVVHEKVPPLSFSSSSKHKLESSAHSTISKRPRVATSTTSHVLPERSAVGDTPSKADGVDLVNPFA